jgi:hypothetical protein
MRATVRCCALAAALLVTSTARAGAGDGAGVFFDLLKIASVLAVFSLGAAALGFAKRRLILLVASVVIGLPPALFAAVVLQGSVREGDAAFGITSGLAILTLVGAWVGALRQCVRARRESHNAEA